MSNLPLFQAGTVVKSVATRWTTLLELKINPDEEVYIDNVYIDMAAAGSGRKIRVSSNNEVLQSYEPEEGYIFMLFVHELKFTTADEKPLVIQYKTDGINDFSGEAQIIGVRRKTHPK